jgi:putative ATP-dependent endonuclease of OLD family
MNSERSAGGPVVQLLRSLVTLLRPGLPRQVSSAQVLVVVEGPNDIEFLRRISAILHREDPSLPDLADMERQHALVFVPSGGVDLSTGFRFASLRLPEFHLLDRDVPPATQTRYQVAAIVNSRPRCRAAITSKRSLENYLHGDAIFEASGISVAFSDEDNVPELIARHANERHASGVRWDDLSARARKRLCYKAKKWLNTRAVEQMTPARLAERDGGGEVRSWLASIAVLSSH